MRKVAIQLSQVSAAALALAFMSQAAHAQSGASSSTPATGAVSTEEQQTPATTPGAAPVEAQSTEPERVQLDDIVVTARKRAVGESLQAAPVSATAIGGDTLALANAVNLVDISKFSPGVSLQGSSVKGNQNFSIRGVGISGTTPSDEPTVGIFQDGVYWGSNTGALGELFDFESVEVLRGPQGTLFGRNVTGGAVVLHSARPTFSPTASVSAGYGYRNTIDGSVILSGPIVNDVLAVRLAAMIRTTDGYFTHAATGKAYGRDTVKLIRPSILFKPTDDLEIVLRGEYYQQSGHPTAVRGFAPQTGLPNPVVTLPQADGYRTSPDYFTVQVGDYGRTDNKVYFAGMELNWTLGPGVLTWINGFRQVDTIGQTDYDGFPTRAFLTNSRFSQHQYSSELRYAADLGDLISFTTGLYYFEQKFDYWDTRTLDRGVTVLAQKAELLSNKGKAVFAEVDIKPLDRLTLTLGGRYTEDSKEARIAPYGSCTPFTYAVCNFGGRRTTSDRHFTPKVGVSFQATPANLFYASYTQGVRSGGFALRGSALINPYRAEQVTAWEVGTKNDFFDRRLRVNLAGYVYDYTDIQRTVVATSPGVGIVQSTFNAAGATIKGLDVSIAAQVTNELRFDVSYGYVQARYRDFLGVANPGALRFVRVPENTGSAGATYVHSLGNGSNITFRASAAYTDKYFYDDINVLFQPGYWLVDSTLQYTLPGGNSSVSLWGKNLTNTEYATWGSNLGTRGQNAFIGNPRTYGIRLSHTF